MHGYNVQSTCSVPGTGLGAKTYLFTQYDIEEKKGGHLCGTKELVVFVGFFIFIIFLCKTVNCQHLKINYAFTPKASDKSVTPTPWKEAKDLSSSLALEVKGPLGCRTALRADSIPVVTEMLLWALTLGTGTGQCVRLKR